MSPSGLPDIRSNPALLMSDSTLPVPKQSTARSVFVHPLAILQILDHHGRRHQDVTTTTTSENGNDHKTSNSMNNQNRVIGTLLGRIDGTTIEVTNCFAVPHAERGDEVAIGKDFNRKMLALHMRSSKDIVVGWYASTSAADNECIIPDASSLIHEFYAGECEDNDPIHLVVDTRLVNDCLQIKAFQSAPLLIHGEHLGNMFHELQLSLYTNEAETICLREMIQSSTKSSTVDETSTTNIEEPSVAGLQVSLEQLYQLLDSTLQYVNSVVDGTIPMDNEKGRQISDTLASIPTIRPEIFDKLFHSSLQDLLMVSYLSNVTRTQMEIAQKLNATLGSK
jgi:translation initiation factor 3 subunit F